MDGKRRAYAVRVDCRFCGQRHALTNELYLIGGPTERGNLDELYPDGVLPQTLVNLLNDLVWCDEADRWVDLGGPGRVVLVPWQ